MLKQIVNDPYPHLAYTETEEFYMKTVYSLVHLLMAFWVSFFVIAVVYIIMAVRLWRFSNQRQLGNTSVGESSFYPRYSHIQVL